MSGRKPMTVVNPTREEQLDSFARSDGDIDWLAKGEKSGEYIGYSDFISSVDVLVVGRYTFEKMITFGKWPYNLLVVLSSQTLQIPNKLQRKVSHLSGSPEEIVNKLAEKGY